MRDMSQPYAPSEWVLTLDSKRYLIATEERLKKAGFSSTVVGRRFWEEDRDVDQAAEPKPFQVPLGTFHDGAGFSYANLPATYEIAHQMDASVPGRPATWARHAVGDQITSLTQAKRGFLYAHGNYLYMIKDRYVKKYTPNDSAGVQWAVSDTHDLGASTWTPGRVVTWNGDMWVARATSAGNQAFHVLQTVATPPTADTWGTGPASKVAKGFQVWKELLGRWNGNGWATASTDPTTEANWSDHGTTMTQIGDPGIDINDVVVWQQYVEAIKADGVWSLDDSLFSRNELADMQRVQSTDNGIGSCLFGDNVLVPHVNGLLRWKPQAWRFLGLEQEGALEGDLTSGWGQCMSTVQYGPMAFATFKGYNGGASICSLQQPRGGRGPLVPHMHYYVAAGYFESLEILQTTSGALYLCALYTTNGQDGQPYIWKLPAANLSPANDPRVPKGLTSQGYLRTSRYYQPTRAVSKIYRCLDLYLECTGGDADEGFQVWYSIDGASYAQMLNSSGSAATLTTDGYHRLYFPSTSAAVGRYCQLEIRAQSSGTSFAIDAIRDMELRGSYRPVRVRKIQATLILGQGELEDRTPQLYTGPAQYDNLVALAGPVSSVISFKDPYGDTGYCEVANVVIKEESYRDGNEPVRVVQVTLYEELYS